MPFRLEGLRGASLFTREMERCGKNAKERKCNCIFEGEILKRRQRIRVGADRFAKHKRHSMITHIRTFTRVGSLRIALSVLSGVFLGLASGGTEDSLEGGYRGGTGRPPSGGGAPSGGGVSSAGMVPDAARKAVARRQEMVAKADEAALRGQRLFADKDYEGAVSEFKKALDLLPDAPVVESRRVEYTSLFADASVSLARQRAEGGRYTEALDLIKKVLEPDVDPENPKARQLLQDLNDPDIYSPAVTPEHIEKVKLVEKALKTAEGHIRIGDYDGAEKKYNEVLNYDPYNSAARRGMQEAERQRRLYYDTAYDHTRSKFLNEVAKQWETSVPRFDMGMGAGTEAPVNKNGVDYINEKLKRIIVPEIEFDQTPLSTAVDFLRQKSRELDDLEADPQRKGISIIIQRGGTGGAAAPAAGAAAPAGDAAGFEPAGGAVGGFGGGAVADPPITLKLSNIPLIEALRYTTDQANLKYKVEPHAVVIVPAGEAGGELYPGTYRVPPSFLSGGSDAGGGGGGGGAAAGDPFADLGDKGKSGAGIPKRKSAREILETVGVTFPPGSSVIYNAASSQLVLRNTRANLDLVEAYVDSIKEKGNQVYITTKFVEITQNDNDEFGFDWTMGSLGVGDKILMGGGTAGARAGDYSATDLPFGLFGDTSPVTSMLRSGQLAIDGNSIDRLIKAGTVNPSSGLSSAPALLSVAGILTNPQFQAVLRAVSQHKGADLLTAPSVVARSGQVAKIEVIREFIYPTDYDPPEVPNIGGGGGGGGGVALVSSIPVTPANPTAFETRNTGVTMEVDPTIGSDGFTIDLNLSPEVVEFEGFINYGSPILVATPITSSDAFGNVLITGVSSTEITPNRIVMPIFNTRKVTTQMTIWDGQTVAIGGLIREDTQHVQDKVPILGDVPFLGQFFRSETEYTEKRNLTIFVTARLIDPSGAPINEHVSGAIAPTPSPTADAPTGG